MPGFEGTPPLTAGVLSKILNKVANHVLIIRALKHFRGVPCVPEDAGFCVGPPGICIGGRVRRREGILTARVIDTEPAWLLDGENIQS